MTIMRTFQAADERADSPCRFRRDERGVIAVMFALMLPILLGAVVLGVEIGNWYYVHRQLQTIADAAAIAGAIELDAGSSTTSAQNRAKTEVTDRATELGIAMPIGYVAATAVQWSGSSTFNGMQISIGTSGNPYPLATSFAHMFMGSTIGMTISSTAAAQGGAGSACVLALNSGISRATEVSGSMIINAVGCALATNSSAANAFRISGSADVTADCLYSVGGFELSGSYLINTACGSPQSNAKPFEDPYEDVDPTAPAGCDQTDYHYSGSDSVALSPGSYCGGIRANGSGSITFNAGTYYVHNGDLELAGSMAVSGSGVTFVLTGDSGGDVGAVKITGSGTMSMSAPTSGGNKGMLVVQDRDATSGDSNEVAGSTNLNLTGAIYTPTTPMDFKGSSSTGNSCIVVIADSVKFTGSTGMATTNCSSAGVELPTSKATISLVN